MPTFKDNAANLAVDEEKKELITQPGGDGDVHGLLHRSGVTKKWQEQGKKWMMFIQDTNALSVKTLPSALGVSVQKKWLMNSVAVPRQPGQAMNAICKLVKKERKAVAQKEIVLDVRHDQLDSLLREDFNKEGDVADKDGLSLFPGYTNTVIFKLTEFNMLMDELTLMDPKFRELLKDVFIKV